MADPVEALRRRLSEVAGLDVAFVFGSRAAGTARPDSDLDVLVVEGPGLDRHALHTAITGVVLGEGVEVNLLRYLPSQMIERLTTPDHPARAFMVSVLDGPKIWLQGDGDRLKAYLAL